MKIWEYVLQNKDIITDKDDRKIIYHLQEEGYFLITVGGDERGPGFVYTIGLWDNFNHPELVIFDMGEDGQHMLRDAANEIISGNKVIQEGSKVDYIAGNDFCFVAKKIDPKNYHDYLGYCEWYYNLGSSTISYQALQLVRPTKSNVYPWDKENTFDKRTNQPFLRK